MQKSYLNPTNMVINSSLIESFYKKAKSLLESKSNEVGLIKKTELVIWLQEQENKVDEVVKKLTNDGAEVTVGTVPIGSDTTAYNASGKAVTYSGDFNTLQTPATFNMLIFEYLFISCQKGEKKLLEFWVNRFLDQKIFKNLEEHYIKFPEFCESKSIDAKKAYEEELYLCKLSPCGLASYNSRTTEEEMEQYLKDEESNSVYGAYKRIALEIYACSYENYFDSTGIRDIKNIAKDVFAQHLTDCNALSSVPEIYHSRICKIRMRKKII